MSEITRPSLGPARAEVGGVEQLEKDATALARDRTSLASYRVKLALDRTTLAWIRTTLTMASFGFGMVAFFRALREEHPQSAEAARMHEGAIQMGMALLFLGIIATVLAGASHWGFAAQAPAGRDARPDAVAAQHHGGRAPHGHRPRRRLLPDHGLTRVVCDSFWWHAPTSRKHIQLLPRSQTRHGGGQRGGGDGGPGIGVP